jgi:hypothetical protein
MNKMFNISGYTHINYPMSLHDAIQASACMEYIGKTFGIDFKLQDRDGLEEVRGSSPNNYRIDMVNREIGICAGDTNEPIASRVKKVNNMLDLFKNDGVIEDSKITQKKGKKGNWVSATFKFNSSMTQTLKKAASALHAEAAATMGIAPPK